MAGLFKEQSFDESNTIYFYWEHDQAGSELEESGSFKVSLGIMFNMHMYTLRS